MTHPTDDRPRVHSGREQSHRERLFDEDFGLVESLRMTGHLPDAAMKVVLGGLFVYVGGWMVANGDPLLGLGLASTAVIGAGLALDTTLCKGTPASVHECRRCRRETDRWRGPTRDSQWVTSVTGQPSAARETPSASRLATDLVDERDSSRTRTATDLLDDGENSPLPPANGGGSDT
jgi:hypothetical protein